jgi:hypothetical protein
MAQARPLDSGCGCRSLQLTVRRDQLYSELARQPEIARVVGGKAGLCGQAERAIMVDDHLFDPTPMAQHESSRQRTLRARGAGTGR